MPPFPSRLLTKAELKANRGRFRDEPHDDDDNDDNDGDADDGGCKSNHSDDL